MAGDVCGWRLSTSEMQPQPVEAHTVARIFAWNSSTFLCGVQTHRALIRNVYTAAVHGIMIFFLHYFIVVIFLLVGSQILIDIYIKLIAPLQCAQQDLFQKPNINNGLLNYITFNFSFFIF